MSWPGYGLVWQPYFMMRVGVHFRTADMFIMPRPGYHVGFSLSVGWMPYRYGNWAFVPGYGWVWQPGYWNSCMPFRAL